ncbi:MAG: hypothetical protein LC646_12720, partial [Xanthomonadaceae bacterium]|nr:hypothetical protein [Xanthomonadaceae bacterium]
MSGLYPWLQGQWRQLRQAREQGRMPHALLLSGPRGVGKGVFAEALAWLADQAAIDTQRASLLLDLSAGAPLQALALAADEVLEQRAAKLARLEAVQTGRED